MDANALTHWVLDARTRTLGSYADRAEAMLTVPYLAIINPPIWEMGHVAWFQEYWVLRRALGQQPTYANADALWSSAHIPHETRWSLPLPSHEQTCRYLETVRDRVLSALAGASMKATAFRDLRYFTMLSVFHEDMHVEAFAYTRQTMAWSAPAWGALGVHDKAGPLSGDAKVAGGPWRLGAEPTPEPLFVFDNEKWAHQVELAPFSIARAPVTQAEYAAFVDDGGYLRKELWSDEGWAWRVSVNASQPLYWRRVGADWERRVFDAWHAVAEQQHRPMIHVCAHEAEAFCRWAGRRLPSEAEWECAAAGISAAAPANLGQQVGDTVDVAAFPEGDSTVGCRQMLGNVWEWTASPFGPYPGFERDPYAEYSEPWFGDHRVLRGGCFVTQPRLLRPTWRNFYPPHRRDVWAGFRTCALP